MKLEVLVNFRGMIQGVQGVEDALQLFAAPVDVMVRPPSFLSRHSQDNLMVAGVCGLSGALLPLKPGELGCVSV